MKEILDLVKQHIEQKQSNKIPNPARGDMFPGIPIPVIPFGFGKPKFSFDEGPSRVRGFGTSGRRKYTPSFDALIFGKKGKAPKGAGRLALGTRPITKKFKWEFGGNSI